MLEVYDTTLRDGEQAPFMEMTPKQKLALAFKLRDLGVNVIEAGFPISNSDDNRAIIEIAKHVKGVTISALARAKKEDIDCAASALEEADDAMLHVFLPVSNLHMKEKLGKTQAEIYEFACDSITYGKSLVGKVIFGAEDATRADPEFLKELMKGVEKAGAETFVIADTVGYAQPEELPHLINYLNSIARKIKLGVHCHNDLGQAVSNTLMAIKYGVTHVQTTLCGIGERAGNASFEQVILALESRPDYYRAEHSIKLRKMIEASEYCADLVGLCLPKTQPLLGDNVLSHGSGIHQDGIIKESQTYEIFDPKIFGKKRSIVWGKHSGTKGIKYAQSHSPKKDFKSRLASIKRNQNRLAVYKRKVQVLQHNIL